MMQTPVRLICFRATGSSPVSVPGLDYLRYLMA